MDKTLFRRQSAHALMLLPPLFWALNFVVGRWTVGQLPPVALSFWRWTGATLIMLCIAFPALRREWDTVQRQWKLLALYAFCGVTAFHTLAYIGLQSTTVANATLMNATQGIVIAVLAWLWLGEKLSPGQTAGIVAAVLGVYIIATRGELEAILSFRLNPGDLLIFTACWPWAVYTVLLRRYPPGVSLPTFLTVTCALGALLTGPFYLVEVASGQTMTVSVQTVGAIAFVAFFSSVVAYYCWAAGTAVLGPITAGMFGYLIPVFGIVAGWLFLAEPLQLYHLPGAALIAWGIWMTALRPSYRRRTLAAVGDRPG